MSYEEAEAHLEALGIDAMKGLSPSLHRIEAICEALDHPERALPAIHISGTNGKSSTVRIASSLLASAGLSVAAFTSPHLQTVRERISLGGVPIPEEEFGEIFGHLHPYLLLVERSLGERLSYFEVLTAMFFLWAAESADVAVVEVGLGGRWDATNVVKAQVAVITNIDLDHQALLGSDKRKIAWEKAGIIKPGSRAVTAETDPLLLPIIRDEAMGAAVDLSQLGLDFDIDDNRVAYGGRYLSISTSSRLYEGLFLPLHGKHQGVNAATALEAVTRLLPDASLGDEVVAEGLGAVAAPGRLESFLGGVGGPTVVLDVAHNPAGTHALVSSLIEAFPFEHVTFVIGILSDKDHTGMLSELTRLPAEVVATQADHDRSLPAEELAREAQALGLRARPVGSVLEATREAIASAGTGELVCITGSHYVVGEARDLLAAVEEGPGGP